MQRSPRMRIDTARWCRRMRPAPLALLALLGCTAKSADVVFLHGHIYTLAGEPRPGAGAEPEAQALAVTGGRIVSVGSDAEIERLMGPRTARHDLHGATVVPGLVDCHVHLANLGRSLREVDLLQTATYDEVIERVRQRVAGTPPGEWIGGRGWDQNDWPQHGFPDHAALSKATPQNPVYLRRVDGHAALVNARALEIAGIEASTPDPPGGRILRRPDGSPTGVLVDAAEELVARHLPPPSAEERLRRMRLALQRAVRGGLTGVQDAGMDARDVAACRQLLANGELPLRLYAMVDATPDADSTAMAVALREGPQPFDASMHLALRAVKLMMDGALGSRGAALLQPYGDAPDQNGLPQYSPEAFYARARPFYARGFQLATHCIGDAANRVVLDTYARLEHELPHADTRPRIEHAQVLSPEDIPRFRQLGVVPSMQPTHCTSDMPWAGDRLGAVRERGAYAWRSLRDTGVVIAAGSDAPVEAIEPLPGVYAAVTRQDAKGWPAGGWHPEQALTRSEALRAFSAWAAFASFTERDLGTLEPGKLADLTVVDRDLLHVPAPEILSARVLLTVVGGDVVYSAAAPVP